MWGKAGALAPCIIITASTVILALGLTLGEVQWTGLANLLTDWVVMIAAVSAPALAYAMVRTVRSGKRLIPGLRDGFEAYRDRLHLVATGLALYVPFHAACGIVKQRLNILYPFWADEMFADIDLAIFGDDPGNWLHQTLPVFAIKLLDIGYSLWFPVNALCFISCLWFGRLRLLLTYFLLWGICGPLGQVLVSAAGPLFWPSLGFGPRFAPMLDNLTFGPVFGARYLWLTFNDEAIRLGAGIAAVPSLHVAGATWVAICSYRSKVFFLGLLYLAFVSVGSVALGWHYAVDGLIGAACTAMMLGLASLYYAKSSARGRRSFRYSG